MSKKPKGYWNIKENVFTEARKYNSRKEFENGCGSAYNSAKKNGWLDEMTWLIRPIVWNKKWTKENVFTESKKYPTRKKFDKGCGGAYNVARVNGWLDEMTWLVDGRVKLFTDKVDCVYRYIWKETNSVYVGRTIHKKERDLEHRTIERDVVLKYAKNNGIEIPPMEVIEDNLTLEEGLDREDYWKNYYKNMGYNILNKAKTGSKSGSLGMIAAGKWTKSNIFKEARKYTTKNEFQNGCGSAYVIACRKGWIHEMDWFVSPQKPSGYWCNKENVFAESKKYNSRNEFQNGCCGAYMRALKNKWLDEMTWLIPQLKPRGYWCNKENTFAESKKYQTRGEFRKCNSSAYGVACKNGWLDEMTWLSVQPK